MERCKNFWLVSVLAAAFLYALCGAGPLVFSAETSGGSVGAKVVGAAGGVTAGVPGGALRTLGPGDVVRFGEEIAISEGGSATIALSDKTLREFAGPATLTIRADAGPAGGTVLGNLTAAMADMLFSGKQRASDAVMATRGAESGEEAASVPTLIHPAPGENLLEAPRQFRWKGIEGVPLYRVSVYSPNQMMWQGTTPETEASCAPKTCEFKPGEVYYWVVEAVVGNTTLRSQAASFAVLAADEKSALSAAMGDADASLADPTVAAVVKARLCLDAGAYSKALELLDKAVATSANRSTYMLRAEANGAIGLAEEALSDYKAAIGSPSSE